MRNHDTPTRSPDIRRRLQKKSGAAGYTIKMLVEALRLRHRYVTGATIALIGFDNSADADALEIIDTLKKYGAKVRLFETKKASFAEYGEDLLHFVRGSTVVVINKDSRFFRALRPKELRDQGVDVIIATSLSA